MKITHLLNPVFYGKPLTFNPGSHRYYWDGNPVPSVTTILGRLNKPMLIQWAADMAIEHVQKHIGSVPMMQLLEEARKAHQTKKQSAADIGQSVHKYAQLVLQGQSPPEPLDGPAQKAIEAFWSWVEQHKIEPFAIERRVFSREHHYAGTCDFYGRIDGELSVLDFKTGNGVYDEAWWQTSAYDVAIREELNSPPATRWIVHLNKNTGEMQAHRRSGADEYYQDMAVWRSLLALDKAIRAAPKHKRPSKKAA